jgi:HD superfamily phosphohydrolases
MRQVLKDMMPSPDPDLVAKIAIGPEKWGKWFGKATDFKEWDLLMTDIVTGDAFGVDRIDYLLRDSHHAGVAYGRFDHYRLIDTLRILRHPSLERPMIGIEKGGIHAAEALQLARQFMFLQLYYHHVRIAYDIHLSEFMVQWLKTYPTDVEGHLRTTDNEVLSAMATAAADDTASGHDPARRIMQRRHFRKIYERNALDQRVHPNAVDRVADAMKAHFGEAAVREKLIPPKQQNIDFPILLDTGDISTSRSESTIYADFKPAAVGFVLVDPEKKKDARTWLAENKKTILSEQLELGV